MQGHKACIYCGKRGSLADRTLTLDHFVPLAKGGTSEPGNLVPACETCNTYKADTAYTSLAKARRDISDQRRRKGTLDQTRAHKAAYAAEVAAHTSRKRLAWALLAAD